MTPSKREQAQCIMLVNQHPFARIAHQFSMFSPR
jgi:hypothetical protein